MCSIEWTFLCLWPWLCVCRCKGRPPRGCYSPLPPLTHHQHQHTVLAQTQKTFLVALRKNKESPSYGWWVSINVVFFFYQCFAFHLFLGLITEEWDALVQSGRSGLVSQAWELHDCLRVCVWLTSSDRYPCSPPPPSHTSPRLRVPPALINDMLSWKAFEVRGFQRGTEGVRSGCVWQRSWGVLMMCGDGTPGRKNRGREGGCEGGGPQAGFSWEGRGGFGSVWNSSHRLEWVDRWWFTLTAPNRSRSSSSLDYLPPPSTLSTTVTCLVLFRWQTASFPWPETSGLLLGESNSTNSHEKKRVSFSGKFRSEAFFFKVQKRIIPWFW